MAGTNNRALRVLVADDDRDPVMTLGILLRSEAIDVRPVLLDIARSLLTTPTRAAGTGR